MKKLLTVLMIALVAALALGLVACNIGDGAGGGSSTGNVNGGGNGGSGITDGGNTGTADDGKFDELDTTEEIYGFSAASAGMLISAMNDGGAATASAAADTGTDAATDADTAKLDGYMALVDSLLADGGFNVTAEQSDREGYAVKSTVSYRDMQGNTVAYVMYYNETLLPDYDRDDDDRFETEEDYAISGIMIIDGTEYAIRGERESESEPGESESETTFRVTLSDTRYMLVEQSVENENGEEEKEYNYSVYENRRLVERSTFEYESERGETEIKMTSYSGGVSEIFFFEKETVRGEEVIRIRVGSAQASDGYYVHILTDAETGETYYSYEKINRM